MIARGPAAPTALATTRAVTLALTRALALAALVAVAGCGRALAPSIAVPAGAAGTARHAVAVGRTTRHFLLHVPPGAAAAARPLLVVLHGRGGDAEAVRHASGLDALADAAGFLVAYPEGSRGWLGLFRTDWNAGACCGAAARQGVDDVGFLRALIDRVAEAGLVDRRRVYVAGFSDGGRMAYHVACRAADVVAAIGVVAGSLVSPDCAPSRPVPVVAFHGTADPSVAYDEPIPPAAGGPLPATDPPLPASVRFWAARAGCRGAATSRLAPDVTRTAFAPCAGAAVVFYAIAGGTHGWPGEPDGAGSEGPLAEVRASEEMVRFFLGEATPPPRDR